MIITPSERRKADQLQAILDGQADADDKSAPLVDLCTQLRSVDVGGDIDPAFRDRLRTRLLAVASVQGIGQESPLSAATRARPQRHRRDENRAPRRLAVASGTLATLVALSGVGLASGDAKPGDALYSVKRSREAAQLALARSDISRGQLHLQFARNRLSEASTVRADSDELRRVLTDMDNATRIGVRELGAAALDRSDGAPLDAIDEFVAIQRRGLEILIRQVPEGHRMRTVESLVLLNQVADRSAGLRMSVDCGGNYADIGTDDELGPLPRRCSAMSGIRPGGEGIVPSGSPSRLSTPKSGTQPDGSETDAPGTNPSASASPRPSGSASASPSPSGTTSGGNLLFPDPDDESPTPSKSPAPSPSNSSGGTQGLLGTVVGTVGGVLGGLLGGFSEPESSAPPAETPPS